MRTCRALLAHGPNWCVTQEDRTDTMVGRVIKSSPDETD